MSESFGNSQTLKDCHPQPFKSSKVAGAQAYLVFGSIAVLFAVAIAYFIG